MAVALHSIRIGNFKIGDTTLVIGSGLIGLSNIECLKAASTKLIVVLKGKSIRIYKATVLKLLECKKIYK